MTATPDLLGTDLDQFVLWYEAKRLRTTGQKPTKNTLRTKRSRLRVCCTVTQSKRLETLGTLIGDRAQVERLLDVLSLRQSTGAMRTAVSTLRDLGAYAQAQGWCFTPQLQDSDMPPVNPAKPITIYTDDEVNLMVGSARARGLRWWAFLATVAESGRRVGEVLNLEWDNLNLSHESPHFSLPDTKSRSQNLMPLSALLRERVFIPENIATLKAETRAGSQRQFGRPVEVHPFPWTLTCVTKMFQRYCVDLGVQYRGFHCFRHTKATNMLAKGVPLQAVSSLLGHKNVQTTATIYNHANALAYASYLDT